MEYLKGRKYEDARMPEVKSKEERTQLSVIRSPGRPFYNTAIELTSMCPVSWLAAIKTLAALHALDPQKIGLGDFGSTAAFYPRQIR